ncbi:Uncharacterised protein [Vibrio cholerae]|nr:Uncharacterised protein [Vibrio cholerae]CSB22590.1 Uncharacterised protein [Vibrio cholerae]CSD28500.1 Uncharacterised protein [Vibrio cholerae]
MVVNVTRNHFFTRARLTEDQHVGFRGRDLLNQVANFLNPHALPNKATKQGVFACGRKDLKTFAPKKFFTVTQSIAQLRIVERKI